MTPEKLGLEEFRRRLVVGSFPEYSSLAVAIERLRFVQADPIRSPARAQDLTLRQRVRAYRVGEVERAYPGLKAEEGYLFAYGFMSPEVWRDLRWRQRAKLTKLELEVLAVVEELGEVHPRGLAERFGRQSVKNCWGGKSQMTKRILEDLHHDGFLRVSRREKGVRVYQVPEDSERKEAEPKRRYARLAMTTAHVFGPTSKRFLISELRSLDHLIPKRGERAKVIDELLDSGQLAEVQVEGRAYVWIRDEWQMNEGVERVRILAPFDPLVRDRQRFEQVWGWSYRFEGYVPAPRRERGYYAMPVLWRDHMIGWANAKVVGKRLNVTMGYVRKRPRVKAFRLGVEVEVEAMAIFMGLKSGAWELKLDSGS
ncbi:MAG: DNA glycosylase AlkZ-like family protein [Verrucomicrobiales bacterium]